MSTQPKALLTPNQYLVRERAAAFKSEFFRGEMHAMAGASRRHNLIVANVVGEMRQALKDRPCEAYPSDMRVQISATGEWLLRDVCDLAESVEFPSLGFSIPMSELYRNIDFSELDTDA